MYYVADFYFISKSCKNVFYFSFRSGGHCNHVVGLLYLLCHWSLLGIKEIPADKTCTSLPQQWHKPRPTDKIEPEPVMKSTFAKSCKDKENKRKRDPIACKLYNADAKRMKSINGRERDILAMSYTLSQEKRKPPFSYLLGDQQCSQIINTVLGNVPLGSYLGYQLFDERKQKVNFSLDRPVTEILTFDNQPDLILAFPKIPFPVNADNNEYERLISERPAEEHSFLQKIRVTTTEAYQIQNLTVQQSLCADWYKYREPRITASNFGRVLTRKMKPTEAFMKSLFQQNDLSKVEAIKHGKQHESLARSIYARKMQKNVNKLFTVYECGLSINPLYPYLGASPDGKIFDPSEKNHFGLLEIKCPFKWRNRSLDEACEDPTFHCHVINGKVHLKRMNVYYAQVQGQLLLTGLSWCDFVVYLSTSRHMNVERIYLDMDYCNFTLLPKLKELYFEHTIKYLMNKV